MAFQFVRIWGFVAVVGLGKDGVRQIQNTLQDTIFGFYQCRIFDGLAIMVFAPASLRPSLPAPIASQCMKLTIIGGARTRAKSEKPRAI
jgi:hypothetical protein